MRRPNARPQACRRNTSTKILTPEGSTHDPNRYGRSFSVIGLVASVAIFAAVSGLLYFSAFASSHKFGVIIDGGSTGTRIHVFGYTNVCEGIPAIDHGLISSMKVVPGLSSFAYNPEKASQSLTELLLFANKMVPKNQRGETEVRLMATAGLRLLDGNLAEGILEYCRSALRGSGFKFQDDWVSVISGTDEGVYAWVAANYALGTLGKANQETTGIVELGGASAQITFVPSEPMPPEFSLVLKFGQVIYNLYSHSFLHLGQNTAYGYLRQLFSSRELKTPESLIEDFYIDPCTPKGYLYVPERSMVSYDALNTNKTLLAFGNFSECRSAAMMLLRKEKDRCSYKNCPIGSTYVPKLQGKLIATENFFHTSKFFGLGPSSFLSDLILAGEQFCKEDWSKLRIKYHALEEEDLLQYCFSSAYIVALLHDCLGIAMNDTRVVFANQVGEVPLDWALGAFILQKTAEGSAGFSNWVAAINVNTVQSHFLSVSAYFSILIFVGWFILKWRKPLLILKTKCDMEKGRHFNPCIN